MRKFVIAACLVIVVLPYLSAGAAGEGLSEYSKPGFGYSATLPAGWTVHREMESKAAARVSFGLPRVWSELEHQEIENAVAVSAYKRAGVTEVKQLLELEIKRLGSTLISHEMTEIDFGPAMRTLTEIRGLKYESLTTFRIENGISFVISFTATPGTYDLNLGKFLAFLPLIVFYPPEAASEIEYRSRFDEALALYRGGSVYTPQVIRLLEEELVEFPRNAKAARLLAATYIGAERFEDAITLVDSTTARLEDIYPGILILKAQALHHLDRNQEARKFLKGCQALFQNESSLSEMYTQLCADVDAALASDSTSR